MCVLCFCVFVCIVCVFVCLCVVYMCVSVHLCVLCVFCACVSVCVVYVCVCVCCIYVCLCVQDLKVTGQAGFRLCAKSPAQPDILGTCTPSEGALAWGYGLWRPVLVSPSSAV